VNGGPVEGGERALDTQKDKTQAILDAAIDVFEFEAAVVLTVEAKACQDPSHPHGAIVTVDCATRCNGPPDAMRAMAEALEEMSRELRAKADAREGKKASGVPGVAVPSGRQN
jgi:UTP:GlnB (protein PII) uridylyltransferase